MVQPELQPFQTGNLIRHRYSGGHNKRKIKPAVIWCRRHCFLPSPQSLVSLRQASSDLKSKQRDFLRKKSAREQVLVAEAPLYSWLVTGPLYCVCTMPGSAAGHTQMASLPAPLLCLHIDSYRRRRRTAKLSIKFPPAVMNTFATVLTIHHF